ncbi:hypothetical protein WBJ53_16260 [Spirosoma sp. SC4-14]|uniref:hypothetical protein n=1 Tax=Spirosoma sp. SC4-14 TaxID=3128900 RepID=UPI0030CECB4A
MNEKQNNWKKRLSSVIYGLLYPAFLGNMVYDLILSKRSLSTDDFIFPDFYTCLIIAIFSVVDYMHLNGDMNDNVPVDRRSVAYILVDAIMPFVFFCAFVSIKEERYNVGVSSIAIIPLLLLLYKWRNKPSRKFFVFYSFGSLTIGAILILVETSLAKQGLLLFVGVSMLIYFIYIACIYPKKPLEFDKHFIKEEEKDY